MEFTLDPGDGQYHIESYRPGSVTINGQDYTCSVLIMPDRLISPWRPNSVSELTTNDFQDLLQFHPQLLLLGTGPKQQFPDNKLFSALFQNNIGVEVMDTAAACRTYTLLMAEGRQVIAGLLMQ
jgi:uncharacterized protein